VRSIDTRAMLAAALVSSSALGFQPMAALQPMRTVRTGAVSMAVSDMAGVSIEAGNKVWDPLGLTENMDDANLNLMRAAELKHCRVAMLATVGWAWTATGTHFKACCRSILPSRLRTLRPPPTPSWQLPWCPGRASGR